MGGGFTVQVSPTMNHYSIQPFWNFSFPRIHGNSFLVRTVCAVPRNSYQGCVSNSPLRIPPPSDSSASGIPPSPPQISGENLVNRCSRGQDFTRRSRCKGVCLEFPTLILLRLEFPPSDFRWESGFSLQLRGGGFQTHPWHLHQAFPRPRFKMKV